jgi:hypothetical protein
MSLLLIFPHQSSFCFNPAIIKQSWKKQLMLSLLSIHPKVTLKKFSAGFILCGENKALPDFLIDVEHWELELHCSITEKKIEGIELLNSSRSAEFWIIIKKKKKKWQLEIFMRIM